jgi:hypothetical protein
LYSTANIFSSQNFIIMKRFKFPVLLLAMGIAIFGAMAANVKPAAPKNFDATYYYVGNNTLAQMQDPNNWQNSGTPCTGANKPCTINWVGTRTQFDEHVIAFPDESAVLSECATFKN